MRWFVAAQLIWTLFLLWALNDLPLCGTLADISIGTIVLVCFKLFITFFYYHVNIIHHSRGAKNEDKEETSTLNRIFSVWLYSMVLPPYLAQHYFSIIWQLVLEDMLEHMLEFSFYHCYFYFYFHILTNTYKLNYTFKSFESRVQHKGKHNVDFRYLWRYKQMIWKDRVHVWPHLPRDYKEPLVSYQNCKSLSTCVAYDWIKQHLM